MIVLAEIMALNRATGLRVPLYVSSSQNATANGLNGKVWNPKILGEVELSERSFNGGFAEAVEVPTASLEINTYELKASDGTAASALGYNGASVNIYAGVDGQAWPWTLVFMGRVLGSSSSGAKRSLSISVNDGPLKKSVLTLKYGGTGGLDGDAGLAGVDKPWLFGTAQNAQPVLINAVNSVYQFSGYGPIKAVLKLYERASEFAASSGNYSNYAALIGAVIPASGWATCLAEGLIRLGAPEAGVITGDVEGDFSGGVFRTRPGQIIQRIAAHLVITASLNTTSLNDFDTYQSTRPSGGHVDRYINSQVSLLDLAQDLAREGLGQAMLNRQDGKLRICRPAIGSAALTFDASKGVQIGIPAWDSNELAASPPYSKIQMSGVISWRVHSPEEVASADLSIDFATQVVGAEKPANNATRNFNRGAWSSAGVAYAIGDEVIKDGSSWVSLTAHTSTAGNGPPTLPTTSNANWQVRAAKGTDGSNGINGTNGINGGPGANGQTTYVHFAYADNVTGTSNFTTGASDGRFYVGVYTDFTIADSTDAALYTWTLQRGADGSNGTNGGPGANGQTTYVHIAYADAIDGSINFTTANESGGRLYIGTYTDFTLGDSTSPGAYNWSRLKGTDGSNGINGINGANAIDSEIVPPAASVQATVSGIPKLGAVANVTARAEVRIGGVLQTSGWTYALQSVIPATAASGTQTAEVFQLTAFTNDPAVVSAVFKIRATRTSDGFFIDRPFNVFKTLDGGSRSMSSTNITSGEVRDGASFADVDFVDIVVPAGATISATASLLYSADAAGGGNRTIAIRAKLTGQNLTDSGAPFNIGSEQVGSNGRYVAADLEYEIGQVTVSGSAVTSATAPKTFRIICQSRKESGNAAGTHNPSDSGAIEVQVL